MSIHTLLLHTRPSIHTLHMSWYTPFYFSQDHLYTHYTCPYKHTHSSHKTICAHYTHIFMYPLLLHISPFIPPSSHKIINCIVSTLSMLISSTFCFTHHSFMYIYIHTSTSPKTIYTHFKNVHMYTLLHIRPFIHTSNVSIYIHTYFTQDHLYKPHFTDVHIYTLLLHRRPFIHPSHMSV